MRRERGDLEQERLVPSRRGADEVDALGREHARQVVPGVVAVVAHLPVAVHVVAVLGVAVAGHVPLAPPGWHAVPRRPVPVQVLAHQRRAVALLLERDRERVALLAPSVENVEAPVGAEVREDVRVVREVPGED